MACIQDFSTNIMGYIDFPFLLALFSNSIYGSLKMPLPGLRIVAFQYIQLEEIAESPYFIFQERRKRKEKKERGFVLFKRRLRFILNTLLGIDNHVIFLN